MMRPSPFKPLDAPLFALFLLALCGIFFPKMVHILIGAAFLAGTALHLKAKLPIRGRASGMRRAGLLATELLGLALAGILLSGVFLSLQAFTGWQWADRVDWRFWHILSSLVAMFALFAHLLTQASRAWQGWRFYGAALLAFVLIGSAIFGIPYADRWLRHVETDVASVTGGEPIAASGRLLTVWFSRSGNTAGLEQVDTVSGASFMLDKKSQKLFGNAEVLALMAQDMTKSDLAAIRVRTPYPPAYSDTVRIAKDELHATADVELAEPAPDLSRYDAVIVVFPLWWGTVPKAVEKYLASSSNPPSKLIAIVTHGSSGAGESEAKLKSLFPGAAVAKPLAVYSSSVPHSRADVARYLEEALGASK
ncbi:MAG TPA: hypothetical protein DCZ56_04040 [Sutterella sp.]|nr:hypothetical protein [Sutterella sp.]